MVSSMQGALLLLALVDIRAALRSDAQDAEQQPERPSLVIHAYWVSQGESCSQAQLGPSRDDTPLTDCAMKRSPEIGAQVLAKILKDHPTFDKSVIPVLSANTIRAMETALQLFPAIVWPIPDIAGDTRILDWEAQKKVMTSLPETKRKLEDNYLRFADGVNLPRSVPRSGAGGDYEKFRKALPRTLIALYKSRQVQIEKLVSDRKPVPIVIVSNATFMKQSLSCSEANPKRNLAWLEIYEIAMDDMSLYEYPLAVHLPGGKRCAPVFEPADYAPEAKCTKEEAKRCWPSQ